MSTFYMIISITKLYMCNYLNKDESSLHKGKKGAGILSPLMYFNWIIQFIFCRYHPYKSRFGVTISIRR